MTEAVPPLPAAPVDFNALHDACAEGKSGPEAYAAAIGETLVETASLSFEGFTMEPTGSGWWQITGPGLDKPVKEQGEDNARARMAELAAAAIAPADDDIDHEDAA